MYRPHTDMTTPFWIRLFPLGFHPYLRLARYDRPIGLWLLFLPCLWSFSLARAKENIPFDYFLIFLFFLGALLTRGMGCTMNDLIDRKIDRLVSRTATRPLALGSLSLQNALLFLGVQIFLSFIIASFLGSDIILLGGVFLFLIGLYPWMKRWTFWPQLFLGVVFNGGIVMAWKASHLSFSLDVFLLYGAALFWTVGYDTIYGTQDYVEDKVLGLKSTAILFENYLKYFVFACFFMTVLLLGLIGVRGNFFSLYYWFLGALFFSFSFQVFKLEQKRPEICLSIFQEQRWVGLWIWMMLLVA